MKQASKGTRILNIKDMLLRKKTLIMRDFKNAATTERHDEVGDLCDQSSKLSEDHLHYRLSLQDAQQVKLLELCLEKLHRGEYGTCEDCSEDIALKRLEVNPIAIRCIDCQKEHEEELRENRIKSQLAYA